MDGCHNKLQDAGGDVRLGTLYHGLIERGGQIRLKQRLVAAFRHLLAGRIEGREKRAFERRLGIKISKKLVELISLFEPKAARSLR